MRELFYKTTKEKVKRLHLPTGESPLAKKVCVNKASEQSAPVAKRGLVFAASRGENVTRNIKKNTQSKNLTQLCNLVYVNTDHSSIQCASSMTTQWVRFFALCSVLFTTTHSNDSGERIITWISLNPADICFGHVWSKFQTRQTKLSKRKYFVVHECG